LRQAKAGDAAAWQRLEFLYTPLVRWWCRRRGVAAQDVDDATQEVFAAVVSKLTKFTGGLAGSFRRWLFTITRYQVAEHHRRINEQPSAAGGSDAQKRLEELPEATDSSTEEEAVSERAILLRRALEFVRPEFRARTWEAAWRAAVDGRPPAEVAAALGMTVGAVYSAKSRVLARLRELLDDQLGDGPDDSAKAL
jgi:RNA polymerase sigma-70 factor (ECF subfamily)